MTILLLLLLLFALVPLMMDGSTGVGVTLEQVKQIIEPGLREI